MKTRIIAMFMRYEPAAVPLYLGYEPAPVYTLGYEPAADILYKGP